MCRLTGSGAPAAQPPAAQHRRRSQPTADPWRQWLFRCMSDPVPLGQDRWEQHIAHIAEKVDVAPTTVHAMVVEASVATGDAQGRHEGHDLRVDLDRGQLVPRTAVEMASEGLSTAFAFRHLGQDPNPRKKSARPTEHRTAGQRR